jgi:hypothetical protein
VEPHPDADGAPDPAAPNARAKVLGEDHDESLRDALPTGATTTRTWDQPRGRHDVNFEDLFDSQDWVKSRFADLENSRNVIAHNNVLEASEIERIRLYLRDWARIVGL